MGPLKSVLIFASLCALLAGCGGRYDVGEEIFVVPAKYDYDSPLVTAFTGFRNGDGDGFLFVLPGSEIHAATEGVGVKQPSFSVDDEVVIQVVPKSVGTYDEMLDQFFEMEHHSEPEVRFANGGNYYLVRIYPADDILVMSERPSHSNFKVSGRDTVVALCYPGTVRYDCEVSFELDDVLVVYELPMEQVVLFKAINELARAKLVSWRQD
ncbi:cupin domain-containing protein [Henriciella algicola]|uniref:hypothetical protein n=1 Tax=Henriciella algicola TaxID=1608422 RepID=UPI0015F8F328|nr:hypothetical protein [Henriciella algicola]